MSTLYDDQDDPLDGAIAAIQGVDVGVQRYQQGKRQNRLDAQRDRDQQNRLFLTAQRLGVAQRDSNARADRDARAVQKDTLERHTNEADRAGAASVMESTLDPSMHDAFEGLKPTLEGMSPGAIRHATEQFREGAKTAHFEKTREGLMSEAEALRAQTDETGKAVPPENGGRSVDMLGGFHDPSKVDELVRDVKNAKTPHELELAQTKLAKVQKDRQQEVLLGEFKENALSELEPLFVEATDMNSRRVDAGMDDGSRDIFAARQRMMDLFTPGRKLSEDKLFSEKNAIREDLRKIGLGGQSKAKGTEKPPASPHDRALDLLKVLPEEQRNEANYDRIRNRFQNEDTMAATSAAGASSDVGGVNAQGGGTAQPGTPADSVGATGSVPGPGSPTPAPPVEPNPPAITMTSKDPGERVAATKQWVESLVANKVPIPFDVAKAAVLAAKNGENVEQAMREALHYLQTGETRADKAKATSVRDQAALKGKVQGISPADTIPR